MDSPPAGGGGQRALPPLYLSQPEATEDLGAPLYHQPSGHFLQLLLLSLSHEPQVLPPLRRLPRGRGSQNIYCHAQRH